MTNIEEQTKEPLIMNSTTSRRKIVTICGSTRFKKEYEQAAFDLEKLGYMVFSVGAYMHADGIVMTDQAKRYVDQLHLDKISISDWIYVINVDGYIGESTKREIEFALSRDIPVKYLEDLLDLRPAVVRHAVAMEIKLRRHDHKTEWRDYGLDRIDWFFLGMAEEINELRAAVQSKDAQAARFEAADVSNYVMMIADIVRREQNG